MSTAAPFARLASQSLRIMVLKAGGGLLAFSMASTMARALGPDEFGQFAVLLSAGLVGAQLITLGQPKLLLRFLGAYQGTGQPGLARGLIGDSRALVLAASLVAALGAALLALGPLPGAWPLIVLIPVLALAEWQAHLARALGALEWALGPLDLAWRGGLTLAGLAIAASGAALSGSTVIGWAALALAALIGAQAWRVARLARRHFGVAPRSFARPEWRQSALGLWGLAGLSLMPQVITLVLAPLTDPASCGAFFAAIRVVGLCALPIFALNMAAAPGIAGAIAGGNPAAVQQMFRRAMRVMAPGALVSVLALWATAPWLLGLFGETGPDALAALPPLLIGALANVLAGPVGLTLQMTGHDRAFLAISASANAAALLALPLVVPVFGLPGAALCLMAAQIAWNLGALLWCRSRLGLDPSVFCLISQPQKDAHA